MASENTPVTTVAALAGAGLEVPAGGYGGWKSAELPLEPEHTALAVMHAWDCGTRGQYPGWHRAVEYLPRARAICRDVFPGLLDAVRRSPLRVFHAVGGGGLDLQGGEAGGLLEWCR